MSKVMLVEDDNNLREIYEARLQAEGYTIVSAHDGEEALVIAKAEKPDLVISDVMMPKISGFEMLDILRNTDGLKEVKVIMLTALGQSDDQQRADKLGADRYLVKSQVTLEDIVKAAHELLGDNSAEAAAPPTAAEPTPTETSAPAAPAPAPEAAPATPPATAEPAKAEATPAAAPTPPAEPATDAAAPVTPPAASDDDKPTTAPPLSDNAAADDKVMADAVNKLIENTDKQADAAPETKPAPAATDTDQPEPPTTTDDKDEPANEEDVSNSHVEIANKKIIQPIEDDSGKDINQLLAEEEAKETASTPGNVSVPSASASDQAAESTASEEAAVDAKIEDFVAGATTDADMPASNPAITPEAPSAPAPEPKPEQPPADNPNPAPAASQPAPAPEKPAQPTIKPIVISEDAPSGAPATSLSGNPGVPTASPGPGDKTPPDPNTIAL